MLPPGRGALIAGAAVCGWLVYATAGGADAAPSEVVDVRFTARGLEPPIVAVRPGGTVRWVNGDTVSHNTTHLPPAGTAPRWNAYEIVPGGVFTHTFTIPDTYRYFDFFDADSAVFQGVVVVTTGGVPPTPTRGPTEVPGLTRTPEPTATERATPTLTPPPVTVIGRISSYGGQCDADALLTVCSTGQQIPVKAGYALDAYLGVVVRADGIYTECPAGGQSLLMTSIQPMGQPCGDPSPTPPPTPTPAPGANLARGGLARASMAVPGYPATNLTDGNPLSLWYASAPSAWAYVDLGHETSFNQVVLDWSSPHALSYGLYVWDPQRAAWSGLYWTEMGRGTSDTVSLRPTFGRYVLVYAVTSSRSPAGYALGEFRVYGRERPNLALGAAVVASGAMECCQPWHAVDGDYSTGWASPDGQDNPWLRIHLPPGTEISELRLLWDQFAYAPVYSLVFYDAGVARQSIVPGDGSPLRIEFPVRPVVADTVLVYAHELTSRRFMGLGEIELYGPRFVMAGAAMGAGRETLRERGAVLETHPRFEASTALKWLPKGTTRLVPKLGSELQPVEVPSCGNCPRP